MHQNSKNILEITRNNKLCAFNNVFLLKITKETEIITWKISHWTRTEEAIINNKLQYYNYVSKFTTWSYYIKNISYKPYNNIQTFFRVATRKRVDLHFLYYLPPLPLHTHSSTCVLESNKYFRNMFRRGQRWEGQWPQDITILNFIIYLGKEFCYKINKWLEF